MNSGRLLPLLLLLATACGGKKELTKPVRQHISESIYASGTIKSEDQYQVFPTVSGIVSEVLKDDGDPIVKGGLIMRLDNRAQQLNSENAALTANYNSTANNSGKLADALDAVGVARQKLQNDSLLYVRTRVLFDSDAETKVNLEQRQLAYESSRNSYQSAVTRYLDLKNQLTLNAIQSQNMLRISEKTVQDFEIKSDLTGRVYSVLKKKGDLVTPQTPVAVVGSADKFVLEMQVDEYDIAHVNLAQKVYITTDSYKGMVFEAKVTKIDPLMNVQSKTFTVEAVFTKAPPKIFPNTSFEASIVQREKANALVIPKRFLLPGDEVELADGTRKKVKVGLADYENVEILSGITAADELRITE